MKVYGITRTDIGGGYTTTNIDDVKIEIETEVSECPENFNELPIVIENALLPEFLTELKNANIGDILEFEMYSVKVKEMSEEEYNSLSEFGGW